MKNIYSQRVKFGQSVKMILIEIWKEEPLVFTRRVIKEIQLSLCTTKDENHFKTDVKELLKCNLV